MKKKRGRLNLKGKKGEQESWGFEDVNLGERKEQNELMWEQKRIEEEREKERADQSLEGVYGWRDEIRKKEHKNGIVPARSVR